jgi:hypothetical protein
MYAIIVLFLMMIIPIIFTVVDGLFFNSGVSVFLITGKWFVFWGVGLRLIAASYKQIFSPEFTAREVFEVSQEGGFAIVRELGFSLLAIGILGTCSLFIPNWRLPAALVGGLFFAFAGLGHLIRKDRNKKETLSMLSDFWISLICAVYCIYVLII